ncbi:hypothetical protein BJ875DRAFT_369527 [Amylocarpus encephaloides]|uniref:Transcription factor domain-containing protein n=1 Tax=Amylocarpus encephaloides TaxID=45428 RepID=A0A9P7YQ77_9HELO|nr:hypothetical protein BJ875DRAFT_369527 [Amylocarpus encephaloides]
MTEPPRGPSKVTPYQPPTLAPAISEDPSTRFARHFFTVFILKNDFAVASLDVDTITSSFQTSPSLHHAIIAIGALSLSKRVPARRKDNVLRALASYRTALLESQKALQEQDVRPNDSGLWNSFFLGLFELMLDSTGESWLKHILFGTSKMLQVRGPQAHVAGPGRAFFLTIRVFEICRSLIYSDATFLMDNEWKAVMGRMWEDEFSREWHPKEDMLDLMIECSGVWDIIDPDSRHPPRLLDKRLVTLAAHGLHIQSFLLTWHSSFLAGLSRNQFASLSPQSQLAALYYHATSIFLDGIFSYRSQFDRHSSPTLPREAIQDHVSNILTRTKLALETTNLAGVLFFFPLRVAGARAILLAQQELILELLREISNREFVVAEAFREDLKNLWHQRSISI